MTSHTKHILDRWVYISHIIFLSLLCVSLSLSSFAQSSSTDTASRAATEVSQFRSGVIVPAQRTRMVSRLNGVIKKAFVTTNSKFKRGDVLLELDCSVERAELEEARLSHQLEKLKYDQLKAKGIDDQEQEAAALTVETKLARLNAMRAKIQYCEITAPYDGQVAKLFVSEHEGVSAWDKVIEIINSNSYEFHFFLPIDWQKKKSLAIGDQFNIEVDAKNYTVQLTSIAIEADAIDRSFKTVAKLLEPDSLPLGITGRVYLHNLPKQSR